MIRTRVGYAGGKKKNPTYENVGDHAESIQIEYDPARISYRKLLEVFWSSHNPCAGPGSLQYRSIVFFHNEEQKKLAGETRDTKAVGRKAPVRTEIIRYSSFHPAESYHQKYLLRQSADLMKEFSTLYPEDADFIASTAAARVNGYVSGYGDRAALEKEIGHLGLSAAASKRLLELVKRRK